MLHCAIEERASAEAIAALLASWELAATPARFPRIAGSLGDNFIAAAAARLAVADPAAAGEAFRVALAGQTAATAQAAPRTGTPWIRPSNPSLPRRPRSWPSRPRTGRRRAGRRRCTGSGA